MGVPCHQFDGQELGTHENIKAFYQKNRQTTQS
jgi:glutathione peroxidase-family protein